MNSIEITLEGVVAGLALLGSIFSAIYTYQINKKNHILAEKNSRLNEANIEMMIAQRIAQSREVLRQASLEVANLESDEKKRQKAIIEIYQMALEDNRNAYDEACQRYLDEKVDKVRFKKTYFNDIGRLIKLPDNKNFYDRNTSEHEATLKVYDEWYKLEK